MEVRDSGDGVPPDRLFALNDGVGLTNTRARLTHLYGSGHHLSFSNLGEGGFQVSIGIPFHVGPLAVDVEHAEVA